MGDFISLTCFAITFHFISIVCSCHNWGASSSSISSRSSTPIFIFFLQLPRFSGMKNLSLAKKSFQLNFNTNVVILVRMIATLYEQQEQEQYVKYRLLSYLPSTLTSTPLWVILSVITLFQNVRYCLEIHQDPGTLVPGHNEATINLGGSNQVDIALKISASWRGTHLVLSPIITINSEGSIAALFYESIGTLRDVKTKAN